MGSGSGWHTLKREPHTLSHTAKPTAAYPLLDHGDQKLLPMIAAIYVRMGRLRGSCPHVFQHLVGKHREACN